MRLADSLIRTAISHADEPVRIAATRFFAESFSHDETIMPLVILAVEKYGRENAFSILRIAEHLRQTPATVDWLIEEMRRPYRTEDLDDDNYRFAIALILCSARPEILIPKRDEIVGLSAFPRELREGLDQRIAMLSWQWEEAWDELERLVSRGRLTAANIRRGDRLVESLARHRGSKAHLVIDWLQQPEKKGRMTPWIAKLAGMMRLGATVPRLIEFLSQDDAELSSESVTALIQIDGSHVPSAIADAWPRSDKSLRLAATDVLSQIHSGRSPEYCVTFFDAEEDTETKVALAHAMLSHFDDDCIDRVRQLAMGLDALSMPLYASLRDHLVIACSIIDVSFPELDDWRGASREGRTDARPSRLADLFRADRLKPDSTGNDGLLG